VMTIAVPCGTLRLSRKLAARSAELRDMSLWGDGEMHGVVLSMAGLTCALLWLVLLVATSFNGVVVSGGLLGALYVIGSVAGDARRPGDGPKASH